MPKTRPDLIYDVGLFDGGDTAYYLFRGYNVVAIDANPLMIERAKVRFAKELQTGRLTLLNIGVSEAPGTATFWISDVAEWSSFDKSIASRNATGYRPLSVTTMPFPQILAEIGIPSYLKIDIEGSDRLCVDSLKGISELPKHISVEAECVGDSSVLSDEEALSMLYSLRDVGYERFKLVSQQGWTSVRANFMAQFWLRLVTSAARGRLRLRGLSGVAERFTDSTRIATLGFRFSPGSTGPWGDEVPGGWMMFEKARSVYLRERRLFFYSERPLYSFWYDWHATY